MEAYELSFGGSHHGIVSGLAWGKQLLFLGSSMYGLREWQLIDVHQLMFSLELWAGGFCEDEIKKKKKSGCSHHLPTHHIVLSTKSLVRLVQMVWDSSHNFTRRTPVRP